MTLAREAEGLAARFGLRGTAVDQLGHLAEALASDPAAPIGAGTRSSVVDVHLADSLVALDLPEVRSTHAIADLGAGAGLPGLPLAIALPRAAVRLVDSSQRRCAFLRHLVDAIGASNVEVVCSRAEEWEAGIDACDLVTARALAPLAVLVEYAAPVLEVGGSLVAWKGARRPTEEDRAAGAAAQLGLEPQPPTAVRPYPGSRARNLHLYRKVSSTPPGFPRRAGMAAKRPLGRG